MCFVLLPHPLSLVHKHACIRWKLLCPFPWHPLRAEQHVRRESSWCQVSCEDSHFFKLLVLFFKAFFWNGEDVFSCLKIKWWWLCFILNFETELKKKKKKNSIFKINQNPMWLNNKPCCYGGFSAGDFGRQWLHNALCLLSVFFLLVFPFWSDLFLLLTVNCGVVKREGDRREIAWKF